MINLANDDRVSREEALPEIMLDALSILAPHWTAEVFFEALAVASAALVAAAATKAGDEGKAVDRFAARVKHHGDAIARGAAQGIF